MYRPLRIEFAGALYHLTSRGNGREDIYLDDVNDIPALHKRPIAKPLADYARRHKSRNQAITVAYRSGGYSQKQIADYFELHYSWISKIVKKLH